MLTSDDHVPVRSAFTLIDPSIAERSPLWFWFPGGPNSNLADIAEGAHYTLHEAIHGIDTLRQRRGNNAFKWSCLKTKSESDSTTKCRERLRRLLMQRKKPLLSLVYG